jgi:hypothetical protein
MFQSIQTGRRIPVNIVHERTARGHRVVPRSPCRHTEKLSPELVQFCKMLLQSTRAKSSAHQVSTAPQQGGALIFAQWDGRTYPDVEWALDITRQSTLEFPGIPDEVQLQLLMPTRKGSANAPTFSSYDALSRNYFVVTNVDSGSGWLWSSVISGDMNSSTSLYPKQTFGYTNPGQTMVGMETVYLDNKQLVLVFFDDGSVEKVDPSTGAGTPYTTLVNASRQINCVVYRENSREILVLTQTLDATKPNYSVLTFNYATKQTTEVVMQVPQYFVPGQEAGFEMLWVESLQNLLVFFTGNFDQILYVNPANGAASLAMMNMAQFTGSQGHLEFTVSTFLEDLDTDANAAIDVVGQQIYFQVQSLLFSLQFYDLLK